jgi:cytochrome c-type biogenesis protein CcmH/NrfG
MATQTTAIQGKSEALAPRLRPYPFPAFPWRDPHSVPPEQLAEFIASLTEACANNPADADLHTCLGIAHAMNYDVYRSTDALEEARRIAPENFFAQFKYSELFFRLRAMDRAENETIAALNLAANNWELAIARRQLSEIRRLKRQGLLRPLWIKSLKAPAIGFLLLLLVVSCCYLVWK